MAPPFRALPPKCAITFWHYSSFEAPPTFALFQNAAPLLSIVGQATLGPLV
jgi:hypothetical protein